MILREKAGDEARSHPKAGDEAMGEESTAVRE